MVKRRRNNGLLLVFSGHTLRKSYPTASVNYKNILMSLKQRLHVSTSSKQLVAFNSKLKHLRVNKLSTFTKTIDTSVQHLEKCRFQLEKISFNFVFTRFN